MQQKLKQFFRKAMKLILRGIAIAFHLLLLLEILRRLLLSLILLLLRRSRIEIPKLLLWRRLLVEGNVATSHRCAAVDVTKPRFCQHYNR